jgi:hypothetical protein
MRHEIKKTEISKSCDSAPQPAQQVLRVDGLGEDLKLVAPGAGLLKQVGGGGLA